jgi:Ca2+-binding EF-hand superfamily protein
LIAPAAVALYIASQQEESNLCEASRADRIRGSYENKIRFFASPEKVFEVFATEEDEGGNTQMSFCDFLECLTPYNFGEMTPSAATNEYLKKHTPDCLRFADVDDDGNISFTEFIFFLTLHQAPKGVIRRMFKKYNYKMTKEEFS